MCSLVGLALCVAGLAAQNPGGDAAWDKQRLIAALAAVEGRLRSIEVEASCSLVDGADLPVGDIRLRMTRMADPGSPAIVLSCPEILPRAEGGFVECERTDAWDGALGMSYTAAQGRAGQELHAIRRCQATAEPPAMLRASMVRSGWVASVFGVLDGDRVRLSDALADAGNACTVAERDGLVAVRVVHEQRAWEFELEPRHSGPALRACRVLVDRRVAWEVKVSSFLAIGEGLEFPAECELVNFDRSGKPRERARTQVSRARANPEIGERTFHVDLPPGARVTDVTGKTAIVGVSPAEIDPAVAANVAAARTELTRFGARSRGRGAATRMAWLGATALGLGLAAFAVWRRSSVAVTLLLALGLAGRAPGQWSAVWTQKLPSERLSSCGLNAGAFVARWHDCDCAADRLAREMPLGNDWGARVTLADISRALTRVAAELRVEAFRRLEPRDLIDWLRPGRRSVVLHTDASDGHFLVAIAADDDAALIVDPLATSRWVSFTDPRHGAFWRNLSGAGLLVEARSVRASVGLAEAQELTFDAGTIASDARALVLRQRVRCAGPEVPALSLAPTSACACLTAVEWSERPPVGGGEGEVALHFDPAKWRLGAFEASAAIRVVGRETARDVTVRVHGQRGEPVAVPVRAVPTRIDFGRVPPNSCAKCEVLVVVPFGQRLGAIRLAGEQLSAVCTGGDTVVAEGQAGVVMRYEVALRVPTRGQRSGRWFGEVVIDSSDGAIHLPVVAHIAP
jgi:hypothetical protein